MIIETSISLWRYLAWSQVDSQTHAKRQSFIYLFIAVPEAQEQTTSHMQAFDGRLQMHLRRWACPAMSQPTHLKAKAKLHQMWWSEGLVWQAAHAPAQQLLGGIARIRCADGLSGQLCGCSLAHMQASHWRLQALQR